MAADGSLTPPARHGNGRFGPGNPGRRPGSRNQASRQMVMLILEHFERNRDKILDHMAFRYSPAYGALISHFLPRQIELTTSTLEEVSDADIARMISDVRITLGGGVSDPRGTLIELEAIMTGESGG